MEDLELKNTIENLLMRFNQGEKTLKHSSSVPTHSPKTFFEQFYLYESGTTRRLYVWINGTWVALSETDTSLYIKKDGTVAFTGEQSMGTHKLTNVVNPTANQDAATKKYVDDSVGASLVTGEAIDGSSTPQAVFLEDNAYTGKNLVEQTKETGTIGVIYGNEQSGQYFKVTAFNRIAKLTLFLQKYGSPPGNLNVSLYNADENGYPTGSVLATKSVSAGSIGTSFAWYDFEFTSAVTVTPNNFYVIDRKSVV